MHNACLNVKPDDMFIRQLFYVYSEVNLSREQNPAKLWISYGLMLAVLVRCRINEMIRTHHDSSSGLEDGHRLNKAGPASVKPGQQ